MRSSTAANANEMTREASSTLGEKSRVSEEEGGCYSKPPGGEIPNPWKFLPSAAVGEVRVGFEISPCVKLGAIGWFAKRFLGVQVNYGRKSINMGYISPRGGVRIFFRENRTPKIVNPKHSVCAKLAD